jgi:hypothetical protein
VNRHLIFYLVEAALLSLVAWTGLTLALTGLRRLGASVRMRKLRTLLGLWLLFSVVGVACGERFGPEFVTLYYVSVAIALGGVAIVLVSLFGRTVLVEERNSAQVSSATDLSAGVS